MDGSFIALLTFSTVAKMNFHVRLNFEDLGAAAVGILLRSSLDPLLPLVFPGIAPTLKRTTGSSS